MNEAKKLQAAYRRVADIQAQQAKGIERRAQVQEQHEATKAEIEAAQHTYQTTLHGYLGGANSEAEVNAAIQRLDQAKENLRLIEEKIRHSSSGGFSTDVELMNAKSEAASARQEFCERQIGPKASKIEKATASSLLEAYAMRLASLDPSIGSYGQVDWGIFLESVFPPPPEIEMNKAVQKAISRVEQAIKAGK